VKEAQASPPGLLFNAEGYLPPAPMVLTVIVMIPMMVVPAVMWADVDVHTGHPNSYVSLRRHNDGTRRRKGQQRHEKRFHIEAPF
jgi:hypothetical protein